MTKSITGTCPFCRKFTTLREPTFSENVSGLFSFVGEAITGGVKGKANVFGVLVEEINDDRSFPNYNCISCGKETMQCSKCEEIIPYAHSGAAHVCHAIGKNVSSSNQIETPTVSTTSNAISLLEQLATLRDKGILSDEEFLEKKTKILKDL